jgi:hypothetical protein
MSLLCRPETTVITSPFCNFCFALLTLIDATSFLLHHWFCPPTAVTGDGEPDHFPTTAKNTQILFRKPGYRSLEACSLAFLGRALGGSGLRADSERKQA